MFMLMLKASTRYIVFPPPTSWRRLIPFFSRSAAPVELGLDAIYRVPATNAPSLDFQIFLPRAISIHPYSRPPNLDTIYRIPATMPSPINRTLAWPNCFFRSAGAIRWHPASRESPPRLNIDVPAPRTPAHREHRRDVRPQRTRRFAVVGIRPTSIVNAASTSTDCASPSPSTSIAPSSASAASGGGVSARCGVCDSWAGGPDASASGGGGGAACIHALLGPTSIKM
ncbi:hypothetical protein FB451DRAFT_1406190 [Mycena latifolia]|nr:hypothetical protein FB451DRAFT_1406190 [Mycena latifolia]